MFLTIRMILYFIFAALGGLGIGLSFDQATGDVTFNIDLIVSIIISVIGYFGTYRVSRIVKRRGGKT